MTNTQYNHVIVSGSMAYDDIMNFPSRFMDFILPEKLHQINVSFVVDKLEKQLGGTATNIAYNLSILTDKKISLLAGIGKDGDIFLNFLRQHGIDVDGILVDKELYTATGKAITDVDNNQIWGFYYGACEKGKDISLEKYLTDQSIVILSATHPKAFMHFQEESIRLGATYLYDPGMIMTTLSPEKLREGVLHSTWFVGNDYEISQILHMTGLTIPELLNKGIQVITTLGDKGVKYQSANEELSAPAYTHKETVDPTGAGDAWRGGFISGIIEGKTIIDCLHQANALASFAVEHYGTVNHTPMPADVSDRIRVISAK